MGATNFIIKEVQSMVDKIKEKDQTTAKNNNANTLLINKLKDMEKAYAKKTKEEMPDYNRIVPINITNSPIEIEKKNDNMLSDEADNYIKLLKNEGLEKINNQTKEKMDSVQNKKLNAYKSYKQNIDSEKENFQENRENKNQTVVRNGIASSSINTSWENEISNEYIERSNLIKTDYENFINGLNKEIDTISQSKNDALIDFNLYLAGEYEKKLSELKKEQMKAIEEANAYNQKLLEQEQDLNELRQQAILNYQNEWAINKNIEKQLETEKEMKEGYNGEKADEMQNRYNMALNFYKSIDKNEEKNLIDKNETFLKSKLGLYYTKLIENIY